MIEKVEKDDVVLGIIVRNDFNKEGVSFFTPEKFSQQLGFMRHPAGKIIESHIHNSVPREVEYTQEVLFIRRGRLRVDFFDEDKEYVSSRVLREGDVILLAHGGHGFEVLEETEMFEVKQGPHAGEKDKTRFECEFSVLLPETEND